MARKDLPNPNSPNYLSRLREEMHVLMGKLGNGRERALTLADAIESGVIVPGPGGGLIPGPGIGGGSAAPYEPDLTPPPQPGAFMATPAISHILIEQAQPFYTQGHGHLRTHVYGAIHGDPGDPLPVFADAIEVGQFDGTIWGMPSNPATTWHLWIKWESVDGVLSATPAGGTNGVAATTGQDVSSLLEALTGQITSSELSTSLSTPISQIPGIASALAQEILDRAQADADEAQDRADAIQAAADAAAADLAAEVGNRVAAISAVDTAIRDDLATADAAVVTALTSAFQSADAAVLASANSYTFSKTEINSAIAALGTQLTTNFQAADAATLASAQSFTYSRSAIDAADTATLNTLRAEFAAADSTTLAAAQNYTYAKATIDSAIATSASTLRSQLTGGSTATDLNMLSSGLLYQMRETSAAADNALAQQITLLSAGAGEQFDYSNIWYYDAGTESWTTNSTGSTLSAVAGWLRLVSNSGTLTDRYFISPDNLGINGSKYPQVRMRVRKVGSPTWEGAIYFITTTDATYNVAKSLAVAEPTYDANGIGLVTFNMPAGWTSATIRQIRFDASGSITPTDYFELDWVAIGRPSPGASSAQLQALQTAMIAGDDANAQDIVSLNAAIAGKADSSALSALETRVTSAEGVNTSQGSSITSLQNSVTTINSTLSTKADASALTALTTRVTSAEGVNTTQGSSITDLQNSLATTNSTVATKADASALSALDTRVTATENTNTSQATSITNLNSSLATTNTNVTAAQTAANNAATAAAAAQTTANSATTSAATANTLLADIASDAKLTPVEKQSVRSEWNVVAAEKAGINTQASTFSVTTENTAYNNAFQTLANYLNAGATWTSGVPSWISDANLSATTTIVGATFRSNWQNLYTARTALLNAIAAKAKALADAAQATANAANTLAGTKADASALNTTNTNVSNLSGTVTALSNNYTAFKAAVEDPATGLASKASVAYVDQAEADAVSAAASAASTLVSSVNSSLSAAISAEATTRATQTGELYAQYTLKADVGNLISGYGLASTANNSAPTSAFGIQAGQFFVAPPTVNQATAPSTGLYKGFVWRNSTTGLVQYWTGSAWSTTPQTLPFVVQAVPTTVNGVAVPAGMYAESAFIMNGTITNAKIANLAVDDAKIASLSVSKLTAGSVAVGQYAQSTGYVAGSSGWRINGDGTAEFSGVVVRGTIFASQGAIGGWTIGSNYLQSNSYVLGESGTRLNSDGTGQIGGVRVTADSVESHTFDTPSEPYGFRLRYDGSSEFKGAVVKSGTGRVLLTAVGDAVPPWVTTLQQADETGVSLVADPDPATNTATIKSLVPGYLIDMDSDDVSVTIAFSPPSIAVRSDQSQASTTWADVQGVVWTLDADSYYEFDAIARVDGPNGDFKDWSIGLLPPSGSVGNGISTQLSGNLGSTPAAVVKEVYQLDANGRMEFVCRQAATGIGGTPFGMNQHIKAFIYTASAGQMKVQFRRASGTASNILRRGSVFKLQKVQLAPELGQLEAVQTVPSSAASSVTGSTFAVPGVKLEFKTNGTWSLTRNGTTTLTGSWLQGSPVSSGQAGNYDILFEVSPRTMGGSGPSATVKMDVTAGTWKWMNWTRKADIWMDVSSVSDPAGTRTCTFSITTKLRQRSTGVITTVATTSVTLSGTTTHSSADQGTTP
jgi:hypothetical protein